MKNIKYYINNFLIYSMIGFILETTLKYTIFPNINNGFLFGPWIPIYGFGVCIIIIISKTLFNNTKIKKFIKPILILLISMIVLTILEYMGGNLLELVTHKVYWDYSNLKYHIGKYIALEISIIWGILSIIVTYIIKPNTDKLIKKIPSKLTYLVLIIFIIDFIITIINHLI